MTNLQAATIKLASRQALIAKIEEQMKKYVAGSHNFQVLHNVLAETRQEARFFEKEVRQAELMEALGVFMQAELASL